MNSDFTVSGVLSDAYIINDVTGCVKVEDDEEDDEDVPEEDIRLNNPSYEEVVKPILIVESYSVFRTFGERKKENLFGPIHTSNIYNILLA